MSKPRLQHGRNTQPQQGNTLIGIFVGIVIGVVIAAGLVWFLNRSNSPFHNKEPRPDKTDKPANTAGTPPAPLPAKPGDKRFDFYTVLPSGNDAPLPKAPPPAQDKTDNAANATSSDTEAAPPVADAIYLQAGAFGKKADADNLKAKLALIGVEANVAEATIPDKGKMFRVRAGPYAKVEEMNRVRRQMSDGGIEATVVKVKE